MAEAARAIAGLDLPQEPGRPAPGRGNLFELAYERVEEMIVACEIRPGTLLAINDLQRLTGFGRTPIHQAVTRLAADTLINVRSRQGLQVAPVDLARERTLLTLRRDLERFVIRLAAERAGPSHRNGLRHIIRLLRSRPPGMTVDDFDRLDRGMDRLTLAAAGEPFLEHTLRPLHTIFRRIGWIYHSWTPQGASLDDSVERHLAILDALVEGRVEDAVAASDDLMGLLGGMFDVMERHVDPATLDGTSCLPGCLPHSPAAGGGLGGTSEEHRVAWQQRCRRRQGGFADMAGAQR